MVRRSSMNDDVVVEGVLSDFVFFVQVAQNRCCTTGFDSRRMLLAAYIAGDSITLFREQILET